MTFCEECREMVAYKIKTLHMTMEIKGKSIEFEGKEAYCPECDSKLFVAELRDYNLKQLDIAYRKAENLITVSEIEHLLQKYNIGKRPLSNLLGWGDITLTRYLDGSIPTKQYSDRLLEISGDINAMEAILDKNKELIADSAYKKCIEAIERTKSLSSTNIFEKKIDSVTKYLLLRSSEITPLALQKLLYYTQGFNKVFNDVFLFEEDCEAWSHGPVYPEIYHSYKNFGYNPIELEISYDDSQLNISSSEKEVLDAVIGNFGCYSGKVLELMTHSEQPWLTTRNGLSDIAPSNEPIEKELIAKYFEQIKDKYNMLSTTDIRDYSKDLFDKLFR